MVEHDLLREIIKEEIDKPKGIKQTFKKQHFLMLFFIISTKFFIPFTNSTKKNFLEKVLTTHKYFLHKFFFCSWPTSFFFSSFFEKVQKKGNFCNLTKNFFFKFLWLFNGKKQHYLKFYIKKWKLEKKKKWKWKFSFSEKTKQNFWNSFYLD